MFFYLYLSTYAHTHTHVGDASTLLSNPTTRPFLVFTAPVPCIHSRGQRTEAWLYIHMYIHVSISIYLYLYLHIYICTHTPIFMFVTRTRPCLRQARARSFFFLSRSLYLQPFLVFSAADCAPRRGYIYKSTYMYLYLYPYMYIHISISISIYLHMNTHTHMYEQALVCLSNREIVDASRGRTFHCKMANNRFFH